MLGLFWINFVRNHGSRTHLAFPAEAAAVGGDTTSETSRGRRRPLGSLVHGGFAGAKLDGGHLMSKKSTNQTCSTLHCHQAPSQGSFIIRRPIFMTLKFFEPRSITCSKKSSSSILQHSEHYFFVIPALYQAIHREISSGAAAPAPHTNAPHDAGEFWEKRAHEKQASTFSIVSSNAASSPPPSPPRPRS